MTKLLVYGYCVGVFSSRRIILLRGGCIARVGDKSRCILFRIRRFRLRQQIFDLRTEILSFLFIRSAHRLVRAGIGFDLRAVQRHPAHFQRTRFQRDLLNLFEESLQRLQMDLEEIGYDADVRLIIRRQHPEGDIFHQSPFWLVRIAAAEVAWAVVHPHPCRDEAASWMGHPY